jgi:hypothetical protein
MKIGELFFSLGFKNTGLGEAKAFEGAIDSTNNVVVMLQNGVDQLVYLLEELSVKLGVVTRADVAANKAKLTEKNTIDNVNKSIDANIKKVTTKNAALNALTQRVGSFTKGLQVAAFKLTAVTSAMTFFAKKASDAAVNVDKISTLTGLSANTIQRLGDMAAQTGGNVNDLAGAIQNFQRQSVDIMLGRGGNIGTYQLLGINPHEDPLKILGQVQAKLKSMPTQFGTAMAHDLGLSDDLIYFLKNADHLKPPSEETLLTDKEIKRLKEFNFNFNRIFEIGKRTLQKFSTAILPVVTQFLNAIEGISKAFGVVLNVMDPWMEKIKKWIPLLLVVGGVLLAAFAPVYGVFLLLFFVLQDIASWVNGGNSLFKDIFNWVTDISGMVGDLIDLLLELGNVVTGGKFKDKFKDWQKSSSEFFKNMGDTKAAPSPQWQEYKNATSNIANINVTVNGAKDPKAVVKEIETKVKDVYGNALFQRKAGESGVNR